MIAMKRERWMVPLLRLQAMFDHKTMVIGTLKEGERGEAWVDGIK